MIERHADLVIVGAGLGGVAAALAACRSGYTALLTEETDWIGGQLTTQGVPPDEHPWIEKLGAPASYRQLRDGLRDYYRRGYPLTSDARSHPALNPGQGNVSRACAEPRAWLAVLEEILAPYRAAGRLVILPRHRPVDADAERDAVSSVTLLDLESGDEVIARGRFMLDATETGELLPLSGTEYVTGFESQGDTGEPSAPMERQPLNMQATTWCFAVDYLHGEDHTIDQPAQYARWRDFQPPFWPDKMFSLLAPNPKTLEPVRRTLVPHDDHEHRSTGGGDRNLWRFRRILARSNFVAGTFPSDLVMVNWPMIDYIERPLFEVDARETAKHVEEAREMSLSFLYWMQTELPRPDGGRGLPGLRLRGDVFGTPHGMAKAPYVRESRRIVAERTVVEQDVSIAVRGKHGARVFADSVGVGS